MKIEYKLFIILAAFFAPRRRHLRHLHALGGAGRTRRAVPVRGAGRHDRLLPVGHRTAAPRASRGQPRAVRSPSRRASTASSARTPGGRCRSPAPPPSASSAWPSAGGCSSSAPRSASWPSWAGPSSTSRDRTPSEDGLRPAAGRSTPRVARLACRRVRGTPAEQVDWAAVRAGAGRFLSGGLASNRDRLAGHSCIANHSGLPGVCSGEGHRRASSGRPNRYTTRTRHAQGATAAQSTGATRGG